MIISFAHIKKSKAIKVHHKPWEDIQESLEEQRKLKSRTQIKNLFW